MTGGGGEYVSNQFQHFLSDKGILHRTSCPHTPKQNGVAECKHRHIVEMGLSFLAQSCLPQQFWVDSFVTANYLINCLPTPVLKNCSPHSLLFGKEPDYTHLKTFGCACYPLLCPYNSTKLMFRSKRCIFLGYGIYQKGYRCLDPSTNRFYVTRHVVFDDAFFPGFESAPPAPTSRSLPHNPTSMVISPSSFHFENDIPSISTASQPLQDQNLNFSNPAKSSSHVDLSFPPPKHEVSTPLQPPTLPIPEREEPNIPPDAPLSSSISQVQPPPN